MKNLESIRAHLLQPFTVAALAVMPAFAADYYVAADGTGDYSQANPGPSPAAAAELAAKAGDVIHVGPGVYSSEDTVAVAAGVTMVGTTGHPDDVVLTRIVTGINDRVIFLGPNAALRDLTVRGGYTDYQAACVLGYSAASNVHKNFSVSNCVVEGGSAKYKGGGSYGGVWRNCVIRNNIVRNPSANTDVEGSGGGLWCGTLYDCVVTNNTAIFSGGGVAGNAAEPFYATNCLIAYNNSPYGGGAATFYGGTSCQLVDCRIVGNEAVNNYPGNKWGGRGGGVYGCWLTNCVVRGNVATYPDATGTDCKGGGGLSMACAVDCDILENRTRQVSGWQVSGGGAEGCFLESCRVMNNSTTAYGGGTIYSTNVNCWVSGNSAANGGAALGSVFRNCVISNNVTTAYEGGAAYNSSTYNCLVIHNRSKLGAILFRGYHEGDLIVSNTTESVQTKSAGGAISPADGGSTAGCDAIAVNCTIVGNTGGEAALWAVHATNCLVVGNTPCDVKWMTLAHTCMWATDSNPSRPDETAAPCVNGTKIADPKFVAVPGKTEGPYSLRLSSPCKDKGVAFDWMAGAVDILGNPRVKFDAPDIGACECCAQYGAAVIVR